MTDSDGAGKGIDTSRAPPDGSPTPAIRPLAYAPPNLFNRRVPRVDGIVLFLGLAQFAVAVLLVVWATRESRGYYELRDPTWWKWLAWQAQGGEWSCWAWAAASLGAVVGALRPPGRRRRWFLSYVAAWVLAVVACVVALAVLARVRTEDRWVSTYYGTPNPQEWKENRVEPSFFWQLPVAMTITNPLIVLFAFRVLQRRFPDDVHTHEPAVPTPP